MRFVDVTGDNMASGNAATVDGGDMMRYAEYAPKSSARSDADIDRRLVSVCCRHGDKKTRNKGVC